MANNISKTFVALALGALSLTSCNDWLDLLPNNEQVTSNYWKTKEDVEYVVASGYVYMRDAVPQMLVLGELRAGTMYNATTAGTGKIQDFDVQSDNKNVKYECFYKIVNMANSVIHYAPGVQGSDNTYYDALLNSHLCEAYFMRAFAYLQLMKNYKEVPLITGAYVNDATPFDIQKASETAIAAQIVEDCLAALATGAAKPNYETEWQTKGRVTKWAIYALLADVTLWNHQYDECIKYCNLLLNAEGASRPVFMADRDKFFEIFYPGNSNESIMELNWDALTYQQNNNFTTRFSWGTVASNADGAFNISPTTVEAIRAEVVAVLDNAQGTLTTDDRVGRTLMTGVTAGITAGANANYATTRNFYLWKYRGTDVMDITTQRSATGNDANFILYRMAEILLMKAEALTMKGGLDNAVEAVKLINRIRQRAGLTDFMDVTILTVEDANQNTLLNEILAQREIEFLGEGKRWYDVLRLARYDRNFGPKATVEEEQGVTDVPYLAGLGTDENQYKEQAIAIVVAHNNTTSPTQLQSVLQNSWAWYLPLPESDLTTNTELKQNLYYDAK